MLFRNSVTRMSDRAIYERLRRKTLAYERKRFRVLLPWLGKAYPEVLAEFNTFYERLEQSSPRSKNLATTDGFRRFMCLEKGMCDFVFGCGCLLLLLFTVYVMFLGYPIGTRPVESKHSEITNTFSLRIPLLSKTDTVNTSTLGDPISNALAFALNEDEVLNTDVLLEGDCVSEEDTRGEQNVSEQDTHHNRSVSDPISDALAFALNGDEVLDIDVLLEGDCANEEDTLGNQSEQDTQHDRGGSEQQDIRAERSVEEQDTHYDQSANEYALGEESGQGDQSANEYGSEQENGSEQDEMDLADVESCLSSDSGGCDMNTPRGVPRTPSPDPDAFAEFSDFDYEMEMEEFENLREFDIDNPFDANELVSDLASIAKMDFSKYI